MLGILWKHQKCHREGEKHAREEDAVVEGAQARFSTKRNPVRGGVKDEVLTACDLRHLEGNVPLWGPEPAG